jgi:hypothetical protein
MQFDGVLLKEQGVTFAIVIVKPHVLNSSIECDNARRSFSPVFPGVPIILMAQNSRGVPTYQGRTDIVRFLSKVSPSRIPWKRYNYA